MFPRLFRIQLLILILVSAVLAKRGAPRLPTPVVRNGIEYSAFDLAPGCIQAVDSASRRQLWWLQVYLIVYDPGLEKDVQDVHIKEVGLEGNTLVVANERGYRYEVDTESKNIVVKRGSRVFGSGK